MTKASAARIHRREQASLTPGELDDLKKALMGTIKSLLTIANKMGAQGVFISRDSSDSMAQINVLVNVNEYDVGMMLAEASAHLIDAQAEREQTEHWRGDF